MHNSSKHNSCVALVRKFILCLVAFHLAHAVIVIPITLNLPKPYENPVGPAKSSAEILQNLHAGTKLGNFVAVSSLSTPGAKYLHSINESPGIYASHDSFVRGYIVEALGEHCFETKKYSFLLTSIPLNVPGVVGSPANALAIF
jgi:hypothetical protein